MPIPPRVLANKITESKVQNITSKDNTVFTDSYIKYGTAITTVQVQIDEFEIKDENLVIKTSSAATFNPRDLSNQETISSRNGKYP